MVGDGLVEGLDLSLVSLSNLLQLTKILVEKIVLASELGVVTLGSMKLISELYDSGVEPVVLFTKHSQFLLKFLSNAHKVAKSTI